MIKTIDECFFQIQNGANIKQGDVDGGFPITRIETTANDKFNRDRMGYAGITDISKYESYVLEDGDLLMSHINSVQYLGRTVLYIKEADETIIHGMNLLRLKSRRDVINPAYARYCFYGHSFRSKVGNITKKSVNQASFAVKDLKQIKIEVPSLSEQDQIVKVLDKLQNLIKMRKDELSALDDLIKARFVELFGEPTTNPMGWDETTIGDECFYIKDGPHKSLPDIGKENGGHPFISVRNIVNGYIDFSTARYISDADYADAIKKCQPEKGDMLYSKGGTTGIAKLIDTDEQFANWVHVAVLKFDRSKLNGVFFENMLNSAYCYEQSQRLTKGIANRDLVLSAMAQIKMYRPPIKLQQQFAAFVAQTNKSKAAIQKSLDETQLLFDSLMQEYFG